MPRRAVLGRPRDIWLTALMRVSLCSHHTRRLRICQLEKRGGASADLSPAPDHELEAAQLGQPQGAPGVELLGGDAHLAAQAKLPPRR